MSGTPTSVDWSSLTPQAREIAARIALRVSAGLSVDEVVVALKREPERFRFNTLPRTGISKGWVLARMRDLRREIQASAGES